MTILQDIETPGPKRTGLLPILVLFVVFAGSRVALFMLGLGPDPEIIPGHWQHADLVLLRTDYLNTLWFMHAQPPLWNAIIGIAAKLAGGDIATIDAILHLFFVALTFIAGVLYIGIFRCIGLATFLATFLALVMILAPSVVYYENYNFYPHLTHFLIVLLLWFATRIDGQSGLKPVFGAAMTMVLLAWTWALFHPLLVILMVGMFLWIGRRLLSSYGILILILSGFLSAAPLIKNAFVFNIPSASSWLGLNMSQAAGTQNSGGPRHCDFMFAFTDNTAFNKPMGRLDHPSLTQRFKPDNFINMNHLAVADRASECMDSAIAEILADKWTYVDRVLGRMTVSHSRASFQYFFAPDGWAELFAPADKLIQENDQLFIGLLRMFYFLMLVYMALRIVMGPDRRLHLTLLTLVLYFTIVTHFANGGEQHRMRHTIEPIYNLLTVGLLLYIATSIGGMFRRG